MRQKRHDRRIRKVRVCNSFAIQSVQEQDLFALGKLFSHGNGKCSAGSSGATEETKERKAIEKKMVQTVEGKKGTNAERARVSFTPQVRIQNLQQGEQHSQVGLTRNTHKWKPSGYSSFS